MPAIDSFPEVDTPSVMVDKDVLLTNIEKMSSFARNHGVHLRPHVKAHKTVEIAKIQREMGANGLCVAKLDEAEAMAAAGFSDILVAYELVGQQKLERLLYLTEKVSITILVDSIPAAKALSQAATSRSKVIPCLIEVDSGLGRTGVPPGKPALELALSLLKYPGLKLKGLLTHAGHAYAARNRSELELIGRGEAEALLSTAALLRQAGIGSAVLSVGSTPTVRISGAVTGINEIRPGNYVFNDATQVALGVARREDCALSVLTTVISRPTPDRIVIDAGGKTLALDRGAHGISQLPGYGLVKNHQGFVIERLSEEHGIVSLPPESPVTVGDRLEVIPNHACPVVNLTDTLYVHENHRVVNQWRVTARGGVR